MESSIMLWTVGVLLMVLLVNDAQATQEEERVTHAVEIKLYPMSTSDWSAAKSAAFKSVIANETDSYCDASPSSCGLSSAVDFTASEVGISNTEDDSKSMKLTLYVDYPSGTSPAAAPFFVLPSSALKEILEDVRDAVKDNVDIYVTYIGTEYYGIPPDSTANAIIVPLAILTVVVVGIIAIILVHWQTRKEREDRKSARLMEKQSGGSPTNYGTSRTQPQYNILDATNSTVLTTATPRVNSGNKVSPDNYANNHSEKETLKAKSERINTHDTSPRNRDSDPDNMKGSSLPPLDIRDEMTEEERQERKRRKKEKRREKRRLREQGMEMYDNQALDTSNPTEDESRENNVATFSVKREVIA